MTELPRRSLSDPWERILARLVSVPRSRAELARRLRERGCPPERANPLLDQFEGLGLIDDHAYSLLFIDSHRDWGVLRLKGELRERGVSSPVIREALEESGIDEMERASGLAQNWKALGMAPEKIRSRLMRRGFSSSVCREAAGCRWDGSEDFSDGDWEA